jgi:hypothetical protein
MILTFAELGINVADYNGMSVTQAIPAIINHAANRITLSEYAHPATNIETLYNWPASIIDLINHTIEVIPAAYDGWMLINS